MLSLFPPDVSGTSVLTTEDMPSDCKVASCPFTLAITPQSSKDALLALAKMSNDNGHQLDAFTERELICTYIIMHWILEEERDNAELRSIAVSMFDYLPYLRTLPTADALRTPLHFREEELFLLRGTNLYGATLDRQKERRLEWERCRTYVETLRPVWKDRFTWEKYLTAATYLSSRAFPSTILSATPSLISATSSHPVLIPGVDSFNHARGHRVSWLVGPVRDYVSPPPTFTPTTSDAHQISLIIHDVATAYTEVFNNYGPKPNAELILGYGFSLQDNPDDTIVLKVGGVPEGIDGYGKAWEVGRDARGSEGPWQQLMTTCSQMVDDQEQEIIIADWQFELDVAEAFKEMVDEKLTALPRVAEAAQEGVRAEVLEMIQRYVEGQQDILQSLSAFADSKYECAVAKAEQDELELVLDDEAADSGLVS
ncbi:SET domain-containing protein [Gautieria morchelliformis]|nr:SET domain-containing protein [Gautieria morchelliformis]